MRRREFISFLGGAAAAWPVAARGQQTGQVRRIGILSPGSTGADRFRLAAFARGLSEGGFIEGRDVAIDYRGAEGRYDRLPILANELVALGVSAIASVGVNAALSAKAANTTIPIAFVSGVDPVASGLVTSLSRPGGNLTGVTDLTTELAPKHLELLQECLPRAQVVAALVNPSRPDASTIGDGLQAAGQVRDMRIHLLHASRAQELNQVFEQIRELQASGLVITVDAFLSSVSEQLAAMTLSQRVRAIHVVRQFAAAGGLMSYGGGLSEAYRQVGIYVARFLKGERPADLPVQQSTKVELIINVKTANALGIALPITLLGVPTRSSNKSRLLQRIRSLLAQSGGLHFSRPLFAFGTFRT